MTNAFTTILHSICIGVGTGLLFGLFITFVDTKAALFAVIGLSLILVSFYLGITNSKGGE